jgi:hypothetical protein
MICNPERITSFKVVTSGRGANAGKKEIRVSEKHDRQEHDDDGVTLGRHNASSRGNGGTTGYGVPISAQGRCEKGRCIMRKAAIITPARKASQQWRWRQIKRFNA